MCMWKVSWPDTATCEMERKLRGLLMNCHLSSWLQHSHGDNVSHSVSLTARNYANTPGCCNLQLLSVNSNKSKENTQRRCAMCAALFAANKRPPMAKICLWLRWPGHKQQFPSAAAINLSLNVPDVSQVNVSLQIPFVVPAG